MAPLHAAGSWVGPFARNSGDGQRWGSCERAVYQVDSMIRRQSAEVRMRVAGTLQRVIGRDVPPPLTSSAGRLAAGSRRLSQVVPLGEATIVFRALGRYKLFAPAGDVHIVSHLAFDGVWEPDVTCAIARAVQPGAHCVDVGANIGYYTTLLADRAGDSGRVLAVEPNPRLVELIKFSNEANGFLRRVEIAQLAAGSQEGEAELTVPHGRSSWGSLGGSSTPSSDTVPVRVARLDTVVGRWPVVDFVKIDVEGSEGAVWEGMQETVKRCPGIEIVLEFVPERSSDPASLVGSMREAGFILRAIAPDGSLQPRSTAQILEDQYTMLFLSRR